MIKPVEDTHALSLEPVCGATHPGRPNRSVTNNQPTNQPTNRQTDIINNNQLSKNREAFCSHLYKPVSSSKSILLSTVNSFQHQNPTTTISRWLNKSPTKNQLNKPKAHHRTCLAALGQALGPFGDLRLEGDVTVPAVALSSVKDTLKFNL